MSVDNTPMGSTGLWWYMGKTCFSLGEFDQLIFLESNATTVRYRSRAYNVSMYRTCELSLRSQAKISQSDYNHDNYLDLIEHAASVEPTFPVIDNNLINGKGIYNCSLQPSHDCCPYAGLSKFTFYPSKTHRLRLINTGNDGTQKFTIDGHNFTVIANDYVPVQPYTTDVVTLAVGQRTDILVTGTGKGAYWMRSDFDVSCLNLTAINNHALAAIYYVGTNTSSIPTTEATPWQSNNCANVSARRCSIHRRKKCS